MPHYFITGASAGIGEALSRKLAQAGHQVTGLARRQDRLAAIAEDHPQFLGLKADVGNPADLDKSGKAS